MVADFKQGTNLAGKILASGQIAATTATTVYTVPAASAVKIATFSLFNNSQFAVTLAVSVVPSGGTADATRVMLGSFSLAPFDGITSEDVLTFLKGAMLDAGAFISVTAGSAAAVNYLVTGAVSS